MNVKKNLIPVKESAPLLGIVIATRNRHKYARAAVESILINPDPRLELVIQDNSDNRTLELELAPYLEDRRLTYQYAPPPLSAMSNFNKAIELSTAEYICMIGDDDGVNPEILEATNWASLNGIDALVGSLTANFRWAGTGLKNTMFTKMTDSTLTLTHFSGKFRHIDIEKSLRRFGGAGFTYYLEFDLPKLYHGIVKRSLLEELHRRSGNYINALSPDIYLSVALASLAKKLIVVDYPLTLPGVCPGSGSVEEGAIKKHSKKLEDAPHLQGNAGYVWRDEVPSIYCVETLWTESALHALQAMNRRDLLKLFNPYRMYANIINSNPDTKITCIGHMIDHLGPNYPKHYFLLGLAFIAGPLCRFVRRRALSRILVILGLRRLNKIEGLPDTVAATKALSKYLDDVAAHIDSPPFSR